MKKSPHFLWAVSLIYSASAFAQIGGIEDSVSDISDTIRAIFPILLGVIFLVGFLFNAGHFFGENADLKKRNQQGAGIRFNNRGRGWNFHVSHKYVCLMKRYTMYRDIRKEALIMGLPVMLFGVQIVALVLSLFLLIFSFSLVVLLAILLGNIGLYLGLLRYVSRNKSVTFFPGLS